VITSWSYQASTGPVQIKLKVGKEESLTSFTITDESAVETAAAAKLNTFATRLPVEADEVIGLTPVTNGLPCVRGMATGYSYSAYVMGSDVPPGTTATFNPPQAGTQIDIAATLEVDSDLDGFGDESQDQCLTIKGPDHGCPSNDFSFGRLQRNRANGTATLTVIVPNPGDISLAGKGLAQIRGSNAARANPTRARAVNDAGKVRLKIKAKGKKKRKLNRTGSVRVKAKVTFTPNGGRPNTETRRVRLLKK
jgi:hypothetical protein